MPNEIEQTRSAEPATPAPSRKPGGSKWLGIWMLSLSGGALAIFESDPSHHSRLGLILFLASVVLGILSLFYRAVGPAAIAVALTVGIAAAWTALTTRCFGWCPPTSVQTVLTTVIPAFVACAAGIHSRRHPHAGSRNEVPARTAVVPLLSFLFWVGCWCLMFALGSSVNIIAGPVLSLATIAASATGVSFGIDSLRSPRRGTAIAGIVLNIFGLVVGSMWLTSSLPYLNLASIDAWPGASAPFVRVAQAQFGSQPALNGVLGGAGV